MALELGKVWEEAVKLASPKLEEISAKLQADMLSSYEDFIDDTQLAEFTSMLKRAGEYEVKAVTEQDREVARQYSEAAESVLRQVRILVVAEKTAAAHEIGALIESALLVAWDGFKEVGAGLLGVLVKGVAGGLLGPIGGAVVEAAGDFLGAAVAEVSDEV